jgi:hypothetical protein
MVMTMAFGGVCGVLCWRISFAFRLSLLFLVSSDLVSYSIVAALAF